MEEFELQQKINERKKRFYLVSCLWCFCASRFRALVRVAPRQTVHSSLLSPSALTSSPPFIIIVVRAWRLIHSLHHAQDSLTPEQRSRAERFGIDPVAFAESLEAKNQPAKSSPAPAAPGSVKKQPKKKFEGECRNCGKKGHKASECRNPGGGAHNGQKGAQAKKFEGECRNCGKKGHKAAECRNPGGGAHKGAQGSAKKFEGECRNCGKKGHKAAECRSKRRQSSGGNNNSNSNGGGNNKRARREPAKATAPKTALTPAQQAKRNARQARFSS